MLGTAVPHWMQTRAVWRKVAPQWVQSMADISRANQAVMVTPRRWASWRT